MKSKNDYLKSGNSLKCSWNPGQNPKLFVQKLKWKHYFQRNHLSFEQFAKLDKALNKIEEGELEKEMNHGSKESKFYPVDSEQQQKLNLCIESRRLWLTKQKAVDCINLLCNQDQPMLDFFKNIVDKILIQNSHKNQPLDGNALLDFVMNEVYFQKVAILKFYSPLNDQVKAELRKTQDNQIKLNEVKLKFKQIIEAFPHLNNSGNYSQDVDSISTVPIVQPADDQSKPLKIKNIDLKLSLNKFNTLRNFYRDSEVLSYYLRESHFRNENVCPFNVVDEFYSISQQVNSKKKYLVYQHDKMQGIALKVINDIAKTRQHFANGLLKYISILQFEPGNQMLHSFVSGVSFQRRIFNLTQKSLDFDLQFKKRMRMLVLEILEIKCDLAEIAGKPLDFERPMIQMERDNIVSNEQQIQRDSLNINEVEQDSWDYQQEALEQNRESQIQDLIQLVDENATKYMSNHQIRMMSDENLKKKLTRARICKQVLFKVSPF